MSVNTRLSWTPSEKPMPETSPRPGARTRGRTEADPHALRLPVAPSRRHWYVPCKTAVDFVGEFKPSPFRFRTMQEWKPGRTPIEYLNP